jgi:hypothetical protein
MKKDLGQKMEQMYPSSSDAKSIMHPQCSIPLDLFAAQPKVGEKVNVEFEAVVESVSKTSVSLKFIKGEEVETAKEEKTEKETLIG